MRRLWLLFALAGLVAASPVRADGPEPFGYVKGYLFQSLADPYPMDRVGTRLQLGLQGGGGSAGYYLAVDLDLGARLGESHGDESAFSLRPVEAWFELVGEKLELRVGKQYIFWGRATWVNPTDVITAWDYGNMSSELQDYRLAPTAVRLRWLISGELELDTVWVPVFVPSRVPAMVPEIPGAQIEVLPEVRPKTDLLHGEYGVRLSQTLSALSFDWSISAYRGWGKLPRFSLIPEGPGPDITSWTWRASYQPMAIFGLDAAKTIGPLVITGEAAMKYPLVAFGYPSDPQNRRFEYVLGVNWVLSQDLQLGLQNIGTIYLKNPQAPDIEVAFAPERVDQQVSFFLQASFARSFGAQLILIYDATYQDGFAMGFLTWNPIDALNLAAGVVAFAGQEATTPYGRMRDASQVFLEAKYSF